MKRSGGESVSHWKKAEGFQLLVCQEKQGDRSLSAGGSY